MNKLTEVVRTIKAKADPKRATASKWYFKTGPGEYGEGDIFLGLKAANVRQITKQFRDLPLADTVRLLHSKVHEERCVAVLILVEKYSRGSDAEKKSVYDAYLKNTKWINNWDLVDMSAPKIIGPYLFKRNRQILYKLAKSSIIWERRIAVLASFEFVRLYDFTDTLKISEMLLGDKHDLIHKAVGWGLREIGKRSLATEEIFLKKYGPIMPRTMLRYAIEKFPEKKRREYLAKPHR